MLLLDYEKITQIDDDVALTPIPPITPRLAPLPCPPQLLLILDLDLNLAQRLHRRPLPRRPLRH